MSATIIKDFDIYTYINGETQFEIPTLTLNGSNWVDRVVYLCENNTAIIYCLDSDGSEELNLRYGMNLIYLNKETKETINCSNISTNLGYLPCGYYGDFSYAAKNNKDFQNILFTIFENNDKDLAETLCNNFEEGKYKEVVVNNDLREYHFNGKKFFVKENTTSSKTRHTVYDENMNVLITNFNGKLSSAGEDFLVFFKGHFCCLIDLNTMKNIISYEDKYISIKPNYNGTFYIKKSKTKKIGLINLKGESLIPVDYYSIFEKDNFFVCSKGSTIFIYDKNYNFLHKSGKVVSCSQCTKTGLIGVTLKSGTKDLYTFNLYNPTNNLFDFIHYTDKKTNNISLNNKNLFGFLGCDRRFYYNKDFKLVFKSEDKYFSNAWNDNKNEKNLTLLFDYDDKLSYILFNETFTFNDKNKLVSSFFRGKKIDAFTKEILLESEDIKSVLKKLYNVEVVDLENETKIC